MCVIFEFCRNKFLIGVYEGEQSRGISGHSRNPGYLRMNDDEIQKVSLNLLKICRVVVDEK